MWTSGAPPQSSPGRSSDAYGDGSMEDDMEASAQEVPDGCVGTLKKWSGWGRDRKRGT